MCRQSSSNSNIALPVKSRDGPASHRWSAASPPSNSPRQSCWEW